VVAEAVWVGGARMQVADATVVGQTVRVRVTVVRCAVARANGGGWTVMARANGGGSVHACVGPMLSSRACCGAPSSDPVR
jgi:hypothetical protein